MNVTISFPTNGIALNRFVITHTPHKLLFPNTYAYPLNPVAFFTMNIITPIIHSFLLGPLYPP